MQTEQQLSALLADAYDAYANAIYRHCYYQLGDSEKAKELLQDTYLRTWEYLRAGNNVDSMKTFLYRVANNLIVDDVRRRKRKEEVSLDALRENGFDVGVDPTDHVHRNLDVWKTLQELKKKKEYDLIVMRYVNGMRTSDIAQATGLSPNTVAVRLHRIVKRLTKKLFEKKTAVRR